MSAPIAGLMLAQLVFSITLAASLLRTRDSLRRLDLVLEHALTEADRAEKRVSSIQGELRRVWARLEAAG